MKYPQPNSPRLLPTLSRKLVVLTAFSGFSLISSAATVNQTVNDLDWNAALWGAGPSTPTSGNDYVTVSGLSSNQPGLIGDFTYSSRIRTVGGTFLGDTLTISSETEFLIKQTTGATSTGNIILDGGAIRWGAGGTNLTAGIAGTLEIASESWIGSSNGNGDGTSNSILSVSSSLTGSGLLHMGMAIDPGTIALTGDLSGFTGTLDVGNSYSSGYSYKPLTLVLNNSDLSGGTLRMGYYSSTDVLDLTDTISVGTFDFDGVTLSTGTYSVADLNSTFGNGSQFTGTGEITVIPEPRSAGLLIGVSLLALIGLRRFQRETNS